ncbi:MAG TPA: hypothetical protein VGC66_01240 [Pyrinomonadaceae bacterium]|jgi:hypothetical protein
MSVFKTSKGRAVKHFHVTAANELTPTLVQAARNLIKKEHPNVIEIQAPTCRYNCHGFAYADSHGWFDYATKFISDDYEEVDMDSPHEGDVLMYKKKGLIAHSAVVTRVDGNEIVELQSKWGGLAEVFHAPRDVPNAYGSPSFLLRRLPDFVPLEAGEINMNEEEMRRETIKLAIDKLWEPDIYVRVMLASSPEVARMIIEELPGVRELIDIGAEAGKAALDLFESGRTNKNHLVTSISLYLLQRIPTKEAAQPLARFIRSEEFTCVNRELLADAFLSSAGIETVSDDPMSIAFKEAEKFL